VQVIDHSFSLVHFIFGSVCKFDDMYHFKLIYTLCLKNRSFNRLSCFAAQPTVSKH